jgi:hypothetical protein
MRTWLLACLGYCRAAKPLLWPRTIADGWPRLGRVTTTRRSTHGIKTGETVHA